MVPGRRTKRRMSHPLQKNKIAKDRPPIERQALSVCHPQFLALCSSEWVEGAPPAVRAIKTGCLRRLVQGRCPHPPTTHRPQSSLPTPSSTPDIRHEEMKLTLKRCVWSNRWSSKNCTAFDNQTRNNECSSFRAYIALSNLGIPKSVRCAQTLT